VRDLKTVKGDIEKELSAAATDVSIIELVDLLVEYGYRARSSDVHVEPAAEHVLIRFRIDGILHDGFTLIKDLQPEVITRIKVLSGLKTDIHHIPQDGRIKIKIKEAGDVDVRVSIAPTYYGENCVMRILAEANQIFALEDLGFTPAQMESIDQAIHKPYGMILANGPTGSGKTTTLYALLNLLRREGVHISTLEDPIEYALPGVNQVQINTAADLRFASGLRALVRQDPDIIMVGEVRDSETAVMAANAAMTGHLVLTTLHTNDAPSAVTRLLEMKVEDFVVGSIVNLIIAQRLVRKVCGRCATEERISAPLIAKIKEREDIVKALEAYEKGTMKKLARLGFRRGAGCAACLYTGYSGRLGIYELLELNRELHDLVLSHASAERIKAVAQKTGFRDMVADGIGKIFAGQTTFEEVLRTTRNS
jgi:type IV pilus assembly protein PilB